MQINLFGMSFNISKSFLFYWLVDWIWLDISWSFMGLELYNKINLASITSVYVISNISKKEIVLVECHLVFFDWSIGLQMLCLKNVF